MRRLLPVLTLALAHCSDGTVDPSDDAPRDASAPDARILDASMDARIDARADARVDARVDAAAPAEDARAPRDASSPAREDARVPQDSGFDAPNAPALTYLGTTGNDATCSRELRSVGYAPEDDAKHPLFLYFVGTKFFPADQSSDFDSLAVKRVLQAMARRGFVAYGVEYDNLYTSFLVDKTKCLYDAPASFTQRACALPNVDCALGIATWGHSQGALVAHAASNYDDRVRAVWTTGYSGNSFKLAPDRLRVVNGEGDAMNSSYDVLNRAAGTSCASGDTCLRADGSGWILVRKSASAQNNADHCWFDKLNCAQNTLNLEPNWVDAASSAPFALEANADWVAATVRR